MLSELEISNFAIIDHQKVSFKPGLNVISGETGAGKSIILHAIELVLGERPRANLLRAGTESAEVSALFQLEDLSEKIRTALPDIVSGSTELSITRTISAAGKSKVYLNGRLATLALLEETTASLVNICRQNQHVQLLNPSFHRDLLDGFLGDEALLSRYHEAYQEWDRARSRLSELEETLKQKVMKEAELTAISEELGAVELRPGIRSELEERVKRLSNSEGLISGTQAIQGLIHEEGGLEESLKRVTTALNGLQRLDPAIQEISSLFENGRVSLLEFVSELSRYASSIEIDEDGLRALRDHLAEVARLERKYKTTDAGLVELKERSARELSMITGEVDRDALIEEVAKKRGRLEKVGAELSSARERAGRTLAKQVVSELQELSMGGASFLVEVNKREFAADGGDAVQFLIATNKGEPMKPLRQVASGGELSRILLVLKKALREKTGVNILIFDEVDTGISGSVARAVGEKLRDLASGSQVICITHLPQVASLADHHLMVEKLETSGKAARDTRTISVVKSLDKEDRIDEIARMLAGYKVTDAARESARELLGGSRGRRS